MRDAAMDKKTVHSDREFFEHALVLDIVYQSIAWDGLSARMFAPLTMRRQQKPGA
ncbi:MAG: hypothetical protein LBS72_04910 [Oscillospiraceae bacterium]|jgi:hypothetical protein|nr:hypothetical protein [Oscillospiraceae bacterium]